MNTTFRNAAFMPSSVTETAFTQIVWDGVVRRKTLVVPRNGSLRFVPWHRQSSASHCGGPGSIIGHSKWYLWLKGDTEAGFSPIISGFPPVGITPPILQTHLPPKLSFRINWQHLQTKHWEQTSQERKGTSENSIGSRHAPIVSWIPPRTTSRPRISTFSLH